MTRIHLPLFLLVLLVPASALAQPGTCLPAAPACELAPAPSRSTSAPDREARRPLTRGERNYLGQTLPRLCAYTNDATLVAARYRVARIFYEAGHWREAALHFRVIANQHSGHEVAEYAVQLYLDTLNLMASRGPNREPACADTLASAIDPLSTLYCSSRADRRRRETLCETLGRLRCASQRRAAEAESQAGRHAEAARIYRAQFDRDRTCEHGDVLLYNAAVELDAAGDTPAAAATRRLLIRTYPSSGLAHRARQR